MSNEDLSPEQMSRLNSFRQPPSNTPWQSPKDSTRTSPIAGQPDSEKTVLAGKAKPPKEKDEANHKEVYRGAEMSRRKIDNENDAPFLGALNREKLIYRAMRIAGYGILVYDTWFSYEALSIATGNQNAAIAMATGIFFLNYGVIKSLFRKSFVRLFKIDFDGDNIVQAQEWLEWITSLGVILVALVGFSFDFWTNYLGFDYQQMNVLALPWPTWVTGAIFAFFLMIAGHPLVYIADEELQQMAEETPDAKAKANQVKLKNTAVSSMMEEGSIEAQETGRRMGAEKGKAIDKSIRWTR